jgi:hypothetical protein
MKVQPSQGPQAQISPVSKLKNKIVEFAKQRMEFSQGTTQKHIIEEKSPAATKLENKIFHAAKDALARMKVIR